jgi:prophage regulatory protein
MTTITEHRPRRILRRPQVEQRTGLKRSAIYEGMTAGTFPRAIPLAGNAVGWLEHEIDAWIDQKTAERDRLRVIEEAGR